MKSDPLNVLFIGEDGPVAREVAAALRESGGGMAVAPLDEAGAVLRKNSFHAVLFELRQANAAGLFQITSLSTGASHLPLIVLGAAGDTAFAVEAITAGAQDFLAREEFTPQKLLRKIRCAMERQVEHVALVHEKENYHGIFDHLVEGIFRSTPDGRYLLANVALARIYGYPSPAQLMASVTDIARKLYVEPARREAFIRLMQQHDTLSEFESQIYRKDGSVIWISENCRAVRGAQGQLLYYEGTVQDITRRRQAEEALRRSESLYHSLVETMPQGVFRRDLQGRFTFANQLYCKYHRVQPDDLLGKTDFDLYPKGAAEKYWRDDLRVMENRETLEILEETQPFGSPEKRYHQVVKTPLYDEADRVIGLQGMFWDVTEKRRAEEEIRRANAELARSREELRAKNQLLEENLHMAREIQSAILPQQYPSFPKTVPPEQSAFRFTHRYEPAETVSGDFFSVSALSDDEASVLICDVAGHGVRSSLVTAMIRALAEELKPLAREPGLFLRKLNSDLCAILKTTGSPMLTTAFYLTANWRSGILRYANAGHPRPLRIRRADAAVELLANVSGASQPALGLFDDPAYQTTEIKIAPGDFLMLFTDGLYEVQGLNEELYSQERLMMDVRDLLQKPAGPLFDELLQTIRAFSVSHEFEDDVCLVGMEFSQRPGLETG